MELPARLERAKLSEVTWDKNQQEQPVSGGKTLEVQFNPESLKLSYSNQTSGKDQRGGASTQFVGAGSTRLSFDLWFDVNAPAPSEVSAQDVRKLTQQVIYFIDPKPTKDKKNFLAPGMKFQWGSFSFAGTVESLNETLEFFSEAGIPLRAQVSVTLSKQKIVFQLQTGGGNVPGGPAQPPGTFDLQPASQGSTLQSMSAARGIGDWQSVALLNGIEQPRRPAVGLAIRFG
jgi:Contractile injection system tube protein